MSSESIRCPISCPKVKEHLRIAIAKEPYLSDEIFPQKNSVDVHPPQDFILKDTEDEQRRIIVPADIPKTLVDHEKITIDTPLEKAEEIIKPKIIEEKIAIPEPEIIQEVTIIQESTVIPTEEITDHYDEKINSIEEKQLIAEETVVEPVKEIPTAINETEIIKDEIDQTEVPVKSELELPQKPDVDFELKKRAEYGKEEDVLTDYERFIDEELQKSLPAVIAKEIPDEPKEGEIFYKKTDYEELAGPSKEPDVTTIPEKARIEVLAKRRDRAFLTKPLEIVSQHVMRKLKERRRIVNHCYLTRGFNYFEDVCKCPLSCFLYTLSRDQFAKSIFASLALFAVGLKLCSELDAWEMPRRVT